jgi:CubicO group peptidase (beta-lactamase class C family)
MPFIFARLFFITMPALIEANTEEEIKSEVEEYIGSHIKVNQFSGSILVAQNGQVIVKKGYGMANYEHAIPNDPQTKFRIGSLTKSFTAMAIMQLEEKKLLSIEDNLSKYLPDYPNGDIIRCHGA